MCDSLQQMLAAQQTSAGPAHMDCILHTNANMKGQVQMFCFFPTSNIESGRTDRCSVDEGLT